MGRHFGPQGGSVAIFGVPDKGRLLRMAEEWLDPPIAGRNAPRVPRSNCPNIRSLREKL